MKRIVLAALLASAPAFAQPQQIASPSQIGLQINNAVIILAQRAEYAEGQVKALQEHIAQLKAKCGKPCEDQK